MSNIFSGLTVYAGKWELKASQPLDADDKAMFSGATVVNSEYGKSVCFFLKSGGRHYIPMSTQGKQAAVGENVNLDSIEIQVLSKVGESDILRAKINE